MAFDADLIACAELVRKGDPDRFLATMAAPPRARARLFPLYAMNLEIARAPWVTREPMIAEMRLQWWRDALAEIHAGGAVRRHVVVTPLSRVLSPDWAARLDSLVEARRWDIYTDPFADEAAFSAHLADSAGLLLSAAAAVLAPSPEEITADLGWAMGLAGWFRAIPTLESQGRKPLVDGRADAVRALAQQGLDRLARARAQRGRVPGAARPALLAAWQAGPILRQAVRDPSRVAAGSLGQSPAGRRLSLMLRAATGLW